MDTSEQQNPGDAQPVVLVIDDETQMVSIITFALETLGFRCLSANTAEEGMANSAQPLRGPRGD